MSASVLTETLKREDLANAINGVKRTIDHWNASEGPRVSYRGRETKSISERLIAAFGSLFEVVNVSHAEQRIKKTILAIDSFEEAMEKWALDCQGAPEDTNPGGSEEFWKAWNVVLLRFAEKIRSSPQPISAYVQQGLNERQIALQYYWTDENNEPEITKVQEEKAEPGTHFDPETWVHPLDAKEHEAVEVLWRQREVKADLKASNLVRKEAPESVYELLQQGVSSKQILLMKPNSTIEGINAVAFKHNLKVDGVLFQPVGQTELGQEVDPSTQPLGDGKILGVNPAEAGNLAPTSIPVSVYDNDGEKRSFLFNAVLEMSQGGKTQQEIVAASAEDFPQLTVEHVEFIQRQLAAGSASGL